MKWNDFIEKWFNVGFFSILALLVLCSFAASVAFLKTSAIVGVLGIMGSIFSCFIFIHEMMYEMSKKRKT